MVAGMEYVGVSLAKWVDVRWMKSSDKQLNSFGVYLSISMYREGLSMRRTS
jgi:hypothetical protein